MELHRKNKNKLQQGLGLTAYVADLSDVTDSFLFLSWCILQVQILHLLHQEAKFGNLFWCWKIKRTLHYLVYTTDYLLWQFLIIFSPLWLQTEESIFHAARMLLQSFDWIYSRLYFVNYFLFRAYQRGDFPLVLSHTGRGCKLVWKVSIFFLLFLVNSEQILQGHKIFIIIADL